jgi:O-antigen/teichoic acid export membrane protein
MPMSVSFKNLFPRGFLRNIASVSGGQMAAAIVPLVTAPILGRLYSPEESGPLVVFMACAGQLGAIGNWQYSLGIPLTRRECGVRQLLNVCLCAALGTALLSLPVAFWAARSMGNSGGLASSCWFYILPISAFVSGVNPALAALANRWGRFSKMARLQVIIAVISAVVSIVLGKYGFGADGLFISYFMAQALSLALLIGIVYTKDSLWFRLMNWRRVWAGFVRYRAYALYTMPSTFVDASAMNAPNYALGAISASASLGAFGKANQLVGMPCGLVASAVSTVFQRQAAVSWHKEGNCRALFNRTFLLLAICGVLPTLGVAFIAPWFVPLFLGPKWVEAGTVVQILAPLYLCRILSNPLSMVFFIAKRERLAFKLTVATSVFTWLVALGWVHVYGGSVRQILIGYSATSSVMYLLFLSVAWKLAGGESRGKSGI